MVQKPEKWVYYAPYLLHHSFATVFWGFWAFSKRSKAAVQKQRLLHRSLLSVRLRRWAVVNGAEGVSALPGFHPHAFLQERAGPVDRGDGARFNRLGLMRLCWSA